MNTQMEQVTCNLMEKSMLPVPPSSSILKSFHPLAIFGQICGFFPLKNVLSSTPSLKNCQFSLFSYPVLYSIVLNLIFYSLSCEATLDYWYWRRFTFKFSTDAFAIQIFLAVFLFLRFTLHLLCLFRAPKVLECVKQLEAYDSFYNLENKTTLLNKYLAIYLIGTTVNSLGNVSASFPGVWTMIYNNFAGNPSKYFIFTLVPNPEVLAVLVYGIHIIAEAALFFSHCSITFIISGVCDRLSQITSEIGEITKNENYSFLKTPPEPREKLCLDNHWSNQVHSFPVTDVCPGFQFQNNPYTVGGKSILDDAGLLVNKPDNLNEIKNENTEKLKVLCSQYISLVDISRLLNNFSKEIVAVFTTGSTVILVAVFYLISILLTQYVPVSSTRIKETEEIVPIIFIAVITFLRLLNFVNIGEKLRCDGYELVTAIHRLYSSDPEAASVIGYFQQVTTKLKLNLSAGGFFIVRRTVITSILGPMVTFIVILAQFRAADLQLHYSNINATNAAEKPRAAV